VDDHPHSFAGDHPHTVAGLPLIAAPDARVLVLGSAPSALSLQKQEYYGNPQNAFWPLMAELLGRPAGEDYATRTRMLLVARIALWDVLASAERPGSLDASIVAKTAVVNDFEAFFAGHPKVRAVFFNGRTARAFWDREVEGRQALPAGLALTTLPSTSPAHAALTRVEKTTTWRQIVVAAAGAPG
jgi:TDG/mug DNA glycosylase family protein